MDRNPTHTSFNRIEPETPGKSKRTLYATCFLAGMAASQVSGHLVFGEKEGIQHALDLVTSGLDVEQAKTALLAFKAQQMEMISHYAEGARGFMDHMRHVMAEIAPLPTVGTDDMGALPDTGGLLDRMRHVVAEIVPIPTADTHDMSALTGTDAGVGHQMGESAKAALGVGALVGAVLTGALFTHAVTTPLSREFKETMRGIDAIGTAARNEDICFFGKLGRKVASVARAAVKAVDETLRGLRADAPQAAPAASHGPDEVDDIWSAPASAAIDPAVLWAREADAMLATGDDPFDLPAPAADDNDPRIG